MDSVLQERKECFVCHTTDGLHSHHVFYGRNKKWSEKFGLKIWLCPAHHNMSDAGIHFNKELNQKVREIAQRHFESQHGHDEWMRIFGKNYLP